MKRIRISQTSPVTESNSSFPIFARFYNSSEGNLLRYKDGAIPFFIKISDYANNEFVLNLKQNVEGSVRVAKGFVFDKFTVYELSDYGYQSLSPTFEDVTFFLFKTTGYKLSEKDVVLVKNFTMKKAFALIPKTIYTSDINGYAEPSHKIIRNKNFSTINKLNFTDNNVSTFSLNDYKLNGVDNIELYVKEEGSATYQYLPRSEYTFEITKDKDLTQDISYKFIEKQGTYFFEKSKNENSLDTEKIYSHYKVELKNDLLATSSEIYITSNEYYQEFYYGGITVQRRINIQQNLDNYPNFDVYKEDVAGLGLVKLIQGIDYNVTDNNIIRFSSSLSVNDVVEVYLKKDPKIHIAFETVSNYSGPFSPQKALYDNYIAKWNIVPASSFVSVFENGLYKGDHTHTIAASKKYEYAIEDAIYNENLSTPPTGNTNVILLDYSSYGNQTNDKFPTTNQINIKKYQITTDPGYIAKGSEKESNSQEVYLYDKGQNFKLDDLEPYIEDESTFKSETNERLTTVLLVQSIEDPYPSLLPTIIDNYEDFQVVFEGGKTKLTKTLHDNSNVQAIETQISQLKKNYKTILENSNVEYLSYSQNVNAGQFLFLVLKGDINTKFTLVYKDGSNIVKKEYNCTFDSNGIYISIPFFFNTFTNSKSTISFEIEEGTVNEYHIYK
jgi:hypothetical protein